jgi:hypothetical protein
MAGCWLFSRGRREKSPSEEETLVTLLLAVLTERDFVRAGN